MQNRFASFFCQVGEGEYFDLWKVQQVESNVFVFASHSVLYLTYSVDEFLVLYLYLFFVLGIVFVLVFGLDSGMFNQLKTDLCIAVDS